MRFGALGGIHYTAGYSTSSLVTIGSTVGNGSVTAGGTDNNRGELFLVVGWSPNSSSSAPTVAINSAIVDNGTGIVSVKSAAEADQFE